MPEKCIYTYPMQEICCIQGSHSVLLRDSGAKQAAAGFSCVRPNADDYQGGGEGPLISGAGCCCHTQGEPWTWSLGIRLRGCEVSFAWIWTRGPYARWPAGTSTSRKHAYTQRQQAPVLGNQDTQSTQDALPARTSADIGSNARR